MVEFDENLHIKFCAEKGPLPARFYCGVLPQNRPGPAGGPSDNLLLLGAFYRAWGFFMLCALSNLGWERKVFPMRYLWEAKLMSKVSQLLLKTSTYERKSFIKFFIFVSEFL